MQKETNFQAVQSYFENLVKSSRFIKSFTGIFQREYFNKKNSFQGLPSPSLVLFRYELGQESQGQNTIAVRKIGFSIAIDDVPADDFAAQYEAITQAELYANKIIARIRYDSNLQEGPMFGAFIPSTVQIIPFELDAANFGVDVFLSLKNPQNNKVDLADWKDLTKIC